MLSLEYLYPNVRAYEKSNTDDETRRTVLYGIDTARYDAAREYGTVHIILSYPNFFFKKFFCFQTNISVQVLCLR